jgi:hypothetical protein
MQSSSTESGIQSTDDPYVTVRLGFKRERFRLLQYHWEKKFGNLVIVYFSKTDLSALLQVILVE